MAEKEIQIVYTVPNQKVVKVKHDLCDAAHTYTMCNVKSNSRALKELSPNTYKLYMYFDLNQDGYTFALSYQAVHNATGMSDKTYQKAVNELIEKKYLVPSKQKGLYIFYDGTVDSDDRKVENTQQKEKELPAEKQKSFPREVKNGSSRQVETTGEILQDNTKNNIELADAQTTASTMPTEKEKEIASLFEEQKQKAIECYEQGMSFKKDNPQIQQITGLDGKQIYKIVSSYEEEKKNKQQDIYYPDESEPVRKQGVETDFDMDVNFESGSIVWKNNNNDVKRIIKVKLQEHLNNGWTRRESMFKDIVNSMTDYTYQCKRESVEKYTNGLLDALNIKSEQVS